MIPTFMAWLWAQAFRSEWYSAQTDAVKPAMVTNRNKAENGSDFGFFLAIMLLILKSDRIEVCSPLSWNGREYFRRSLQSIWCPSRNGYIPRSLRWIRILILEILQCIPVVRILIRLDLTKTISFLDRHQIKKWAILLSWLPMIIVWKVLPQIYWNCRD